MLHKKAFENGGNAKLLTQLSMDATRLFAETANDSAKANPLGDASEDRQILQAFFAALRTGDPSTEVLDAALLNGTQIADFTGSGDNGGWDEGEWHVASDAQDTAEEKEDDND